MNPQCGHAPEVLGTRVTGVRLVGVTVAPQPVQNFCPGLRSRPQLAHLVELGCLTGTAGRAPEVGVPQTVQKAAFFESVAPQRLHFAMSDHTT